MASLKRTPPDAGPTGVVGSSSASVAADDATRDPAALLAAHPLVASLTDDERAVLLAAVAVHDVAAGSVLIAAGDAPGPLLLVLAGAARVSRDGREVAVVGPGSWLGELSLLEDRPDRADAVAVDDMVVGTVQAEAARQVLALDAVTLQLDSLARRRRASNRATEVEPVVEQLADGGTVLVRPVVSSDWRALAADDGRVSEESLRMRFFTEPPRSERRFRELADPDFRNGFAWAVVADGLLVGIGRYAIQAEVRSSAELAVLVADAHQGRGIGRLLLDALVVAAAAHGVDQLVALARVENTPIQRMLARLGARFVASGDEGVVVARWPLADALAHVPAGRRRAELERVASTVLAPVRDV